VLVINIANGMRPSFSLKVHRVVSQDSAVFSLIERGNPEGLKRLITSGLASPFDVGSDNGWTPLHTAVKMFDITTVELLISMGADPLVQNNEKQCPL
jgi:ankyrin repeat protein